MGAALDLSEYARAIVRGWWIVLVCALIGLAASNAVTASIQPMFESTVRFFVASPPVAGQSALQSDELSRGRIASYAALVKSDQFVTRLVQDAGLGLTASEAQKSISASGDRDTLLITVVVTMPDSTKAFATASAIATNFGPAVNDIEKGRAPTAGQTVLTVVSGPTEPGEQVSPRESLYLGLGVLVGSALGIGISVARSLLDRSLKSPEQIEAATGLPVLARLPFRRTARSLGKLLQKHPETPLDQAARRLRTNIDYLPQLPHLHSLTVTSATAAEGKSTVSLLLARAWADAGHNVVLLEADLHHPSLAGDLGLPKTTGLSNVLGRQLSLDRVIQPTGHERLHALAAGTVPLHPTELLASKQMKSVLAELKESYTKIVVDATSLQPMSDAALMAAITDGVVVVVKHQHVAPGFLNTAIDNLRAVDSRVLGTVANFLPDRLAESDRRGLLARARRAIRRTVSPEPRKAMPWAERPLPDPEAVPPSLRG